MSSKKYDVDLESYYLIYEWMSPLKASEEKVYALIYSMTINSQRKQFDGSAGYLAQRCRISRRQVMNILKNLHSSGFINKGFIKINGVENVTYTATPEGVKKLHTLAKSAPDFTPPVKKLHTPCEKTSHPPCEKTSHNNKDSYIKGYNKEEKEKTATPVCSSLNSKDDNPITGPEKEKPTPKAPTFEDIRQLKTDIWKASIKAIPTQEAKYYLPTKEEQNKFYDFATQKTIDKYPESIPSDINHESIVKICFQDWKDLRAGEVREKHAWIIVEHAKKLNLEKSPKTQEDEIQWFRAALEYLKEGKKVPEIKVILDFVAKDEFWCDKVDLSFLRRKDRLNKGKTYYDRIKKQSDKKTTDKKAS